MFNTTALHYDDRRLSSLQPPNCPICVKHLFTAEITFATLHMNET